VAIGGVCANLTREWDSRTIQNETAIIFDVDDERVDLRSFRYADERIEFASERSPAIDVEAAESIRYWHMGDAMDCAGVSRLWSKRRARRRRGGCLRGKASREQTSDRE
jgi:hypothetical protein